MKSKLAGWKKICAFAYSQSMKSKAMKVTLAILCVLAVLSMPVSSFLSGADSSGSDDGAETTSIKKVYYYDNTGVIAEQFADKLIKSEVYENVQYEQMKEADAGDDRIDELINRADNKDEVFLTVRYCDDENSLSYGIKICTYYSKASDISSEDANNLASFVDENVRKAVLISAGTSEEDIAKISKEIDYSVKELDESGNAAEDDETISQFQYFFTLTCICLMIFVVSLTGSKVSELIVTEKATRVMEYILTSVKPMAVLVGKVIASTLIMLTVLVTVAAGLIVSVFLDNVIFPSEDGSIVLPSVIRQMIDNGAMTGITPLNVILIIVLILLGVVFYGFVAGIAGATVSKIEEMAEGMKIYTFTMMIGAYLPLFMAMTNSVGESGWGNMAYIVYLLPISSMFILPQYLILGKVTAGLAAGAIALQLVFILLVLLLVNKVYEHMLYSNGETLKLRDIIRMAGAGKEKKNAGK